MQMADNTIDLSDPAMWEVPTNRHPLVGKRVRYMGSEWAYAGNEYTIVEVDEFRMAHCKSDEFPGHAPTRHHVSMLDVI